MRPALALRLACCISLFLNVPSAIAQEVEFLPGDWEDPAVFEKGQTDPHALHTPFAAPEAARQAGGPASPFVQSLNGTWAFHWAETPEQVPVGFWQPGFDLGAWDSITVPANWQLEGYGHPKFRNIALSFESDPPRIPDYYNPTGCYKRTFDVPDAWADRQIRLRFEGVKSAAYVWVNGRRVGYNQGGFEPAEFDITAFVQPGANDLAVQVLRFSDGAYLENQDMWRLSGIYREVRVYALPATFVHDHYVVTDLDADYRDATLRVEAAVENAAGEARRAALEIDLLDAAGRSVLSERIRTDPRAIAAGARERLELSAEVSNPAKWSAEQPHRYTLLLHLSDGQGQTLEAFTQTIGFREVEYRDQRLTVNGVAVKLNGVNSHMHHPEHGQAVPLATLRQDLMLMKRFNINCVRTSHYPPTPAYLDLADELGVYVVDEVGDEAHGNTQLSEDPAWTEMYRDRSRKLVHRDRNHPSVLFWSAGNESGSGENIRAVIETGKSIDPSRPAWMYGGNRFYIPFEDIVGPRYWLPLHLRHLAAGRVLPPDDRRASFMDEYIAATGNGLGGMDEYWDLIRGHPRLIGGAIWDFVSPGLRTPRWVLPDRSPAANHGQIMGRPTFTEGHTGRGLELSGHDDWVEFYRHPSLDITGRELAIGFWVNARKIPQPNVFLVKGKFQYGIHMAHPDTLEFYIHTTRGQGRRNATRRIAARVAVPEGFYGAWHHVAGIYDGRSVALYLDGERVAATPADGEITSTPFPLCIGREAETQDQGEYSGRLSSQVIDEVRIFDRAVSVADLRSGAEGAVLDLDFETDHREGDFLAVGLGGRTYGVIWPDRRPQPELHQMKKSGQPVAFELLDARAGTLRLTNHHHFTNLRALDGRWALTLDGELLEEGDLNVDLPAQASTTVAIPYHPPDSPGEQLLLVSFALADDAAWAPAGHEVAWEQFALPAGPAASGTDRARREGAAPDAPVRVEDSGSELRIVGEHFTYRLAKSTGQLTSMRYRGTEYLQGGPAFNVWRAPTANDIDPWGAYHFHSRLTTEGYGRSIDNQLRSLGLRDLRAEVDELEVVREAGSAVVVRVKAWSVSSLPEAALLSWGGLAPAFERRETWTFAADGSIELDQEITPYGPMPDMLPKVGLQFRLPLAFEQVEWYGRGPFETYPDRKTGAKVGRYAADAEQLYEPYLIPQDHGNRTDVRWLRVQDATGKGLHISADTRLNFSLHRYDTDNLSRAMYTYQLREADHLTLNIDYRVSGVGGTALRQLRPYRVPAQPGRYWLRLAPFAP